MRVSGGRRAGRSHRQQDLPCQDAYAVWQDADRAAAAVADGLGSRALSHEGSQAAAEAAVAHLSQEPVWDEAAFVRAFEAARAAVEAHAKERGVSADDLATTLEVAALMGDRAVAAMVGDGAVVLSGPEVGILLAPQDGEYANEVTPLTLSTWRSHFRFAERQGAACLLVFTDGLTRLLLSRKRGQWEPYQPFYDAFLPKLRGDAFDTTLVQGFLETDAVDRPWNDDKCLVVMARDDVVV